MAICTGLHKCKYKFWSTTEKPEQHQTKIEGMIKVTLQTMCEYKHYDLLLLNINNNVNKNTNNNSLKGKGRKTSQRIDLECSQDVPWSWRLEHSLFPEVVA